MKIEHIALVVEDPAAIARWYTQHLGMRTVRTAEGPSHTHFIADSAGTTVLEIYTGGLPVPDYASMDPRQVHLAFATDDVEDTRARLIGGGAIPEGQISVTSGGDVFAMLRDPWGLAIQLVRRGRPLVPTPAG
jgi:catechol 2,3-dioxygenase-like lactoylglutathione lyase family enzyme